MSFELSNEVFVELSRKEIIDALKHDSEFFIEFFLGEELVFPVPDFHKDAFALLTQIEVDKTVLAIPRAHAKTTLAKLAAVYLFLFSPYRFILYVSNTLGIAIPSVTDIIGFIESRNSVHVFGEVRFFIRQEGTGIYKFKWNGKTCILRAHGAGQQVRGINIDNQRPEVGIIDDLEDNDNIATEELYTKLKRWRYGPFGKCFTKKHKLIWLGNMISQRSMLYENCNNPEWFSRVYGCILEDGTPLWEDLWPLEEIRKDFKEYQRAGMLDIWFAEMMNMPTAYGSGLIAANEIYYLPPVIPEEIKFACITVDLAISAKKWAHKSVVTVHVWKEEQQCWQAGEYFAKVGADPIELFRIIISLCQKWKVRTVGIESVAFQAALLPIYEQFCLMEQIKGIEFVPLLATGRKQERITAWAGLLRSKDYALTEGEFEMTNELLQYDRSKKENQDDCIDCAAYISQMLTKYSREIFSEERIEKPVGSGIVSGYNLTSF